MKYRKRRKEKDRIKQNKNTLILAKVRQAGLLYRIICINNFFDSSHLEMELKYV